jgi:hypothetical protein
VNALPDNAAGGAGADGSILFTTVSFANGSGYTITLEMVKGVQLI